MLYEAVHIPCDFGHFLILTLPVSKAGADFLQRLNFFIVDPGADSPHGEDSPAHDVFYGARIDPISRVFAPQLFLPRRPLVVFFLERANHDVMFDYKGFLILMNVVSFHAVHHGIAYRLWVVFVWVMAMYHHPPFIIHAHVAFQIRLAFVLWNVLYKLLSVVTVAVNPRLIDLLNGRFWIGSIGVGSGDR